MVRLRELYSLLLKYDEKYGTIDQRGYVVMFNISTSTGDMTLIHKEVLPIIVSDFEFYVDLGQSVFSRGENVSGKIFAFDSSYNGLTNTTPLTFELYNILRNEKIKTKTSASSVSNGEGEVNISMPSEPGLYLLVSYMNASGEQGVSETWFFVSPFTFRIKTDKHEYLPDQGVELSFFVADPEKGTPIEGASIEVSTHYSDIPAVAVTDTHGKAKIFLDPMVHGNAEGKWDVGWNDLTIRLSVEKDDKIKTFEHYYGFIVKPAVVSIKPMKPFFEKDDDILFDIEYSSSEQLSILSVEVDGMEVPSCSLASPPCYHSEATSFGVVLNITNNVEWGGGRHVVRVEFSSYSGTFDEYSGFYVRDIIIIPTLDSHVAHLNENIHLTVTAMYPNGTFVVNKEVFAKLFKFQTHGDLLVNYTSSITDSNGIAELYLNASRPGDCYILVNVSNSLEYIGVFVSSLKVSLLDKDGNPVDEVEGKAGSLIGLRVNATSDDIKVPDGSSVRLTLWLKEGPVEVFNTTKKGNATLFVEIPPNIPEGKYPLEVRVLTPSGESGSVHAVLHITGGNLLMLKVETDKPFMSHYRPPETIRIKAILKKPDGTPISNRYVVFELLGEGIEMRIDNTSTDSNGVADTQLAASLLNDGIYYIRAYLSDIPEIEAYTGFMVSSLKVIVNTTKQYYKPGEPIQLVITVLNATNQQPITPTYLYATLFHKDLGMIFGEANVSSTQPYKINLTLPNSSMSVGTYPVFVEALMNQSFGFDLIFTEIKNETTNLSLMIDEPIYAGQTFTLHISTSATGSGELVVFSPNSEELIYENRSIPLTGSSDTTVNLTIQYPGIYVARIFVEGVGEVYRSFEVLPSQQFTASLWTAKSLSQNATVFTNTDDIYIITDIGNATAVIMWYDQTTDSTHSLTLPLTQTSGNLKYAVIQHGQLQSGTYFVRVDTPISTGVATTMFSIG